VLVQLHLARLPAGGFEVSSITYVTGRRNHIRQDRLTTRQLAELLRRLGARITDDADKPWPVP
jgi:hypothetical protein